MKNVRLLFSLLTLVVMGSSVSFACFQDCVHGKPDAAANFETAEAFSIYNALKVAFERALQPTLEWVPGETEERSYIEEVEEDELLNAYAGQGQVEPEDVEGEVDLSHLPEDVRENIYWMRGLLRSDMDWEPRVFDEVLFCVGGVLLENRVGLNDVMDIIKDLGKIDGIRLKTIFAGHISVFLREVSRSDTTLLRELLKDLAGDSDCPGVQLVAIQALARNKPMEDEWALIVTTLQMVLEPGLPVRGADGMYDGFRVLQALVKDHGYRDDLVGLLRELVRSGSRLAPFEAIKILAKNDLTEKDWEVIERRLKAFVKGISYGGSVPAFKMRAALGALLALPRIPEGCRDEVLDLLRVLVGDRTSPFRLEAIEVLASHNPTEEDWKRILVILENLLDERVETSCEHMAQVLGRLLSSESSLPEDRWCELWSLFWELADDRRECVVINLQVGVVAILKRSCIQPAHEVEAVTILFGCMERCDYFEKGFHDMLFLLTSSNVSLNVKKSICLYFLDKSEPYQRGIRDAINRVLERYGIPPELREALSNILKEAPEAGPGEHG